MNISPERKGLLIKIFGHCILAGHFTAIGLLILTSHYSQSWITGAIGFFLLFKAPSLAMLVWIIGLALSGASVPLGSAGRFSLPTWLLGVCCVIIAWVFGATSAMFYIKANEAEAEFREKGNFY